MSANQRSHVRVRTNVRITLPRTTIATAKRRAADLGMTLSEYVEAFLDNAPPTPRPASDIQSLGVIGNCLVETLKIAESLGYVEIAAAMRSARFGLLDVLVPRSDCYDDAVVAREIVDYRWRSTTRSQKKMEP